MQRRLPLLGAATLTACAAGFLLFGYSPAPCACETPWQLVYAASGLPFDQPYTAYSAQQVEQGLNRHLAGSAVLGSDDYFFDACKETASQHLRCVVGTEQSVLRQSGFVIDMDADAHGGFDHAHVTSYSTWR
ncbi:MULTISPECIES: hypothetical protein [unclassified Xanthomonas]|uniref:hypothetical protein n=1 Tax=unclassified Xanthomonas TaxID=2643310 RepID=UPI0016397789|nr:MULTISPECIES: hypothetical protein [unclassified Xanthomonas]